MFSCFYVDYNFLCPFKLRRILYIKMAVSLFPKSFNLVQNNIILVRMSKNQNDSPDNLSKRLARWINISADDIPKYFSSLFSEHVWHFQFA